MLKIHLCMKEKIFDCGVFFHPTSSNAAGVVL